MPINRREFVKRTVGAGIASSLPAQLTKGKDPARPNVLYIFDDEHRASSLPGDPHCPELLAPNLDAFRRDNFSMNQCISNYPLCSPHRAMLMSGVWPYQNGVTKNWVELGVEHTSLGQAFASAGYRTSYVGKWHLAGPGFDKAFVPPGPHRQGWQDWHVWGAVDKHYNKSFTYNPDTGEVIHPLGYQSTLMTDQAVKILQTIPRDQPWMMIVSWHPPHFPTDDAPPHDEATYRDMKLALRPNISVGHGDGVLENEASLEVEQRGYYAHITAIDREFARLMKVLEETGQAQNTIVVFTSDHGEMMGSHGRMHKQVPYEESVRVPFFVRYPGVTPKGGTSDALFASIDIYPTVCGLAGIPIPAHVQGKDFSGVFRGKPAPASDVVFLMNASHSEGGKFGYPPPHWRGLRTQTHTYAVADDGRWFLFNNVNDPFQQKNLLADPAEAARIKDFDARIAAWLKAASDPFEYADAITKTSSNPA